MIKQSIFLLNDIFSSFDWLDRYGLVGSPVVRTYPVKGGKTIREIFPAATIASGVECDEKNLYYLVPDERWKSLAYWELLSDYKIDRYDRVPNNEGIEIEFDARLVLWWNTSALGYDGSAHGVEDKMFFTLFTHLDGLSFNNPPELSAIKITYEMTRVLEAKNKIFGRYSYRDSHDWLFQPPNQYLAADFKIKIITTRNCLPELHLGNSDICNVRQTFTWDMAFPGVTTDVYQRWISPGPQEGGGFGDVVFFTVTDFDIPDLSNRPDEDIDGMFLVFAGGRRLSYPLQYNLNSAPAALIVKKDYAPEGTPVELYVRKWN